MGFFPVRSIISSLSIILVVAGYKWPDNIEYYGYQGPAAPLSNDGVVVDTPEVARAKAAHLATHARVIANVKHELDHRVWEEPDDNQVDKYGGESYEMKQPYRGPPAPLGHDGRVVDTAEVARAKAVHLAAHAKAAESSFGYDCHGLFDGTWDGGSHDSVQVHNHEPVGLAYTPHHHVAAYQGPPAPLAPDGRVLDTPEVARAKEAHLQAHAHAAALAAHRRDHRYY